MKPKAKRWIIKDWAGNTCFKGETFETFDDAEAFLSERIVYSDDSNEDERQEYDIVIDI